MFFHRGDNGPFTAFTIGSMELRAAFAVFMNGASGFSIMPEFVAHFVPDDRPSLTWLAFAPHDAPVRRMLRAALDAERNGAFVVALKHDGRAHCAVWVNAGEDLLFSETDTAPCRLSLSVAPHDLTFSR
jgi:hypothetical protein